MKKKNIYILIFSFLIISGLHAQDIYKVENFSVVDLTGTSRYVGMGGSMGALGADISTIFSNPAGIALFRKSEVAVTGSLQNQPEAIEFAGVNKTRTSFDQMGLVYTIPFSSKLKFVNFAFNYQKRRNFKNNIFAENVPLNGLSQSMQMLDLAFVDNQWLDLSNNHDREWTTPLTNLGYDTQMIYPQYNEKGELIGYDPSYAESYNYYRSQWGGIQQFDCNLSFNYEDQIYAGLSFGIQNVNFNGATYYSEQLLDENGVTHPYYINQQEEISGNGFDLKFGVILRPIYDSPFRIGLSIHTPTWYNLTHDSYLYMNSPYKSDNSDFSENDVQVIGNNYKIRTPWKVNLSLGTTIGKFMALNAEYEYSGINKSSISYDLYDMYGWGGSSEDFALNSEISRFLKGVNTIKVGVEARVHDYTYIRFGYNYVSSPTKKEAYLNLFTNSDSYYYNTNTDYINLSSINRITAGLGWKKKHFFVDAAYQFQKQDGYLYPFHIPEMKSEVNRISEKTINLNRHSVQLTLGYKF